MAPAALIVANRLPWPLDDGWKVRTWHSIAAVSELVPTHLVVGGGVDAEATDAAARSWGGRVTILPVPLGRRHAPGHVLAGALTRRPIQYWNQHSREAHRAVRQLVQANQVVLGLAVTTFTWPYLQSLATGVPRVIDTHNVDSVNMDRYIASLRAGPRRWYATRTATNLRHLERDVLPAADAVWVCSPEEAATLNRQAPRAAVEVVPNGVDCERFRYRPDSGHPDRMIFFGRLDYFPNHDAVVHFLATSYPMIRAKRPGIELHVMGPDASPALQSLMAATPGVVHRGRVEDVAATIAEAGVVVVPLRAGGGTRLKILEALAVGVPVVSTPIGAEGLGFTDGEELALEDEPERFAARIDALLGDPDAAMAMGRRGREAVEARFDWAMIRGQMQDALRAITAGPTAD